MLWKKPVLFQLELEKEFGGTGLHLGSGTGKSVSITMVATVLYNI